MHSFRSRLLFVTVVALASASAAIGVLWSGAAYLRIQGATAPQPPSPYLVSEELFQRYVQVRGELKDDELEREWRAARADHRLIANAILACQGRFDIFFAMPREVFSQFLLDLTPRGSHLYETLFTPPSGPATQPTPGTLLAASDTSQATTPPVARATVDGTTSTPSPAVLLSPQEWDLLAFSDAISRARLMAVREKTSALVPANYIWWATLLVSGLATLFVTLQAAMGRSSDTRRSKDTGNPDEGSAGLPGQALPLRTRVFGRWSWIGTVSFLAILLSITGTSLNALKQYFDPTRAVVQNERAVISLRKLHHRVATAGSCLANPEDVAAPPRPDTPPKPQLRYVTAERVNWAKDLQNALSDIISPYSSSGQSESRNGNGT